MSILKKREVVPYDSLSLRIDKQTLADLNLYATFVNRPRYEIVNDLLKYAFSKDKDFQRWRTMSSKANRAD